MVSNERNHPSGMNRLSILYQLPYWQDLLITSLLDPMHIFKNVGQTIWDHFIGIKDKGGWREDLKECHKEHLLHRGPIWSFTKQEPPAQPISRAVRKGWITDTSPDSAWRRSIARMIRITPISPEPLCCGPVRSTIRRRFTRSGRTTKRGK